MNEVAMSSNISVLYFIYLFTLLYVIGSYLLRDILLHFSLTMVCLVVDWSVSNSCCIFYYCWSHVFSIISLYFLYIMEFQGLCIPARCNLDWHGYKLLLFQCSLPP